MCGIVGVAQRGRPGPHEWLVVGRDLLRHRGPDDFGEWWSPDHCVGFGHRRLAVVDLTPAGHQPMLSSAGDLCIVFNGEIYNFREVRAVLVGFGHSFRTASDTEVILAAYRHWGDDCLIQLEGMFALAIYDLRKRRLLLARDRVGEKPLFYTADSASVRFGSELKALLADRSQPRRIDWGALDCYLADGYVGGESCILQGMRKLPPAHALSFELDTGVTKCWRYWSVPRSPTIPLAEDVLLEELEHTLERAVRRQLMADVPVGVLLSGGVDSSLITAFASRAQANVKTFTVRFSGFGAYDETEHARLIARHFGTEHLELEAGEANPEVLLSLAKQFDEPIIDSSMVPTFLVSRLVRKHCTVALGGDGGDELFGGYPHYDRMLRMERAARFMPRVVRTIISHTAGRLFGPGVRGRNWLQACNTDFVTGVPSVVQIFDLITRSRLMRRSLGWRPVAEARRTGMTGTYTNLLERAMRLDFETYLPEDLLVKVDRASMMNSLEVRAPILDARVVELAFGRISASQQVDLHGRKILLKKLAAKVLPQSFDSGRKQGFSVPLSQWLQTGPWRDFFRQVLFDPGMRWCDRSVVTDMLDGSKSANRNGERLFGLVMFELWRREYGIEMDA